MTVFTRPFMPRIALSADLAAGRRGIYSNNPMQPATSPVHAKRFEDAALANYQLDEAYDEMFAGTGAVAPALRAAARALCSLPPDELQRAQAGCGPELS